MSLNQVRSASEASSHPEAGNSDPVTSITGRGAHVVTGRLSPLVHFCDPWSKTTWSPGCQGLPEPTSTREALSGLGHCQRKGTQRLSPQSTGLSDNSSFQKKKKERTEKTRKTGLCKRLLLCTLQHQPPEAESPKGTGVHTGAGGSAGEMRGDQWVTCPPPRR